MILVVLIVTQLQITVGTKRQKHTGYCGNIKWTSKPFFRPDQYVVETQMTRI